MTQYVKIKLTVNEAQRLEAMFRAGLKNSHTSSLWADDWDYQNNQPRRNQDQKILLSIKDPIETLRLKEELGVQVHAEVEAEDSQVFAEQPPEWEKLMEE